MNREIYLLFNFLTICKADFKCFHRRIFNAKYLYSTLRICLILTDLHI